MKAATIPGLLAPQSEGDLGRQVCAYLDLIPGLVYRRTNSGLVKTANGGWVHLAPKGTPDYTGHMPDGRALYIEIETDRGQESKRSAKRRETKRLQAEFIARAAAAGCVAFVACSLEDVARHITEALRHA